MTSLYALVGAYFGDGHTIMGVTDVCDEWGTYHGG